MIWYICFVLALILLGMTIRKLLDGNEGQLRFAKALLLFLAVAYVLYIPIYFLEYDPMAALFADLINLFQLISLDADYLGYYDEIAAGIQFGFIRRTYFLLLGFVHTLMPLATIFTAFTVILHYLSDLRLGIINRKKNSVYIFSEFNDRSLNLARNIHKVEPKASIIFEKTDDDDKHNDVRDALRCMFRFDRITDCSIKMKEDRKVYFYCISDDEDENLDSALTLIRKYSQTEDTKDGKGTPEYIQRNIFINVFSEAHDVESMLDSTDKKLLNVSLIKENYNCIYNLLDRYPLYKGAKDNLISVLIFGYGKMGKALLKTAAWVGQLPGYRLEINIVGRNLEQAESDIRIEAPGLFSDKYNIRFHDCETDAECVDAVRRECKNTTYALVNCGTDEENIRFAAMLRREFYAMDPEFRNKPQIFVYVESHEKHDAVRNMKTSEARADRQRSYDLIPFGDMQSIYTYENLAESDIEKLAFNVHLVYTFGDNDQPIPDGDMFDARKAYNRFEINKESSRANALHIRYKLWLLGLDYVCDENAKGLNFKDFLGEKNRDTLYRAEHDRWEAYEVSEGWVACDIDQVKAYQAVGLSGGRHNCPLLKLHPYICPFDDLKERSDALGLEDARLLDVKMIECIPLILNDHWGQAGKKYKIIKLEDNNG